jgi:hypothetical protein
MLLHPLDELHLLVVVRNQRNASLGFGHVYPIFASHSQDAIDAGGLIHKRFRSQLRLQGSPTPDQLLPCSSSLQSPSQRH